MAAEFDFPLKTTVDVSALDAMLKDKAKYAKLVTIFKFEYLYCHALLMVFFNYIFRDHTWPVLAALALALSAVMTTVMTYRLGTKYSFVGATDGKLAFKSTLLCKVVSGTLLVKKFIT